MEQLWLRSTVVAKGIVRRGRHSRMPSDVIDTNPPCGGVRRRVTKGERSGGSWKKGVDIPEHLYVT